MVSAAGLGTKSVLVSFFSARQQPPEDGSFSSFASNDFPFWFFFSVFALGKGFRGPFLVLLPPIT